ncbi:MAG: MATE family efflux transporter [Eubacteriales bacterium]|nr:MATE family efflux transporter [Eubacteriales bacterium]
MLFKPGKRAAVVDGDNFNSRVIALVVPMALQNLINVGVTATDVIMLGRVGEKALSGASLAGQVLFVLNLFLFGMTSGACVLTAQYWGKNDRDAIEKVLGIVIRLAEMAGIAFMVLTLLFPGLIMRIFSNDPEVIAEGCKYLRIVALTYPVTVFTMGYLNVMKSVEKVLISTIVYASSLVLNFVVNAILIFGLFGAPKLGIVGAAIGTLCARVLELLIVLFYARCFNHDVKVRLAYVLHMDPVLLKDFLHYSGPVILNELFWGLGYSANAAIVGHLGSSAVAANSVAHVCRQLAQVVVFGLGNATAIMIGKVIGEGRTALAQEYARRFVRLSLAGGVIGGALIFLIRPLVIAGLSFEGQTAVYLNAFLGIMAYYVVAQALNTDLVVGIFRAGGDTRFGMILDMTSMWGGSILFGWLAAFVFQWPVVAVYVILLADEIIKLPLCLWRYRQKKWLKNVTR